MSTKTPRALLAAIAVALAGCPGPGAQATCRDLCSMLMIDCGFAAYPDAGSCAQGCLYDLSEGGDVWSLESCVADAACDTSLVLECSRAYGGAP